MRGSSWHQGHCCPHRGAPRAGLPTEGLCLWGSPGAGQGIISRCSRGSRWVPPSLIKTSGPCLTKRRCPAGERSLWAPTEPAQRASRASPAKRLGFWETFSPHGSGVSQEELGDSITPPQTHGPSLLHPLSKSAQISLPLHSPHHLPLGSSSPEDAGGDVLPQGCHHPRLA